MISDRKILQRLEQLKKIEPRLDWKESNREILLSQIKAQQGARLRQNQVKALPVVTEYLKSFWSWDRLELKKLVTLALRPLGTIILVVALALGGGIAAVNAAFDSLPGDALYPVKLTTEKVQLALNFNDSAKTALEIEFAGRRIDEIGKVTEQKIGADQIQVPLQAFTQELGNVNARLDNLAKSGQANEVITLANLVDNKTEDFADALAAKTNRVPSAIKTDINQAITVSEQTSDKAFKILIDNSNQAGGAVNQSEVAKRVEEKINRSQEKIDQLLGEKTGEVKDVPKPEELKKSLDEAKAFFQKGDLSSAFEKVKESNQLTQNIQNLIDQSQATASGSQAVGQNAGTNTNANANANDINTNSNLKANNSNTNAEATTNSNVKANTNTNNNSNSNAKVKGDIITNENASVSGSLLYDDKGIK